jgi:hypothetical protein
MRRPKFSKKILHLKSQNVSIWLSIQALVNRTPKTSNSRISYQRWHFHNEVTICQSETMVADVSFSSKHAMRTIKNLSIILWNSNHMRNLLIFIRIRKYQIWFPKSSGSAHPHSHLFSLAMLATSSFGALNRDNKSKLNLLLNEQRKVAKPFSFQSQEKGTLNRTTSCFTHTSLDLKLISIHYLLQAIKKTS